MILDGIFNKFLFTIFVFVFQCLQLEQQSLTLQRLNKVFYLVYFIFCNYLFYFGLFHFYIAKPRES